MRLLGLGRMATFAAVLVGTALASFWLGGQHELARSNFVDWIYLTTESECVRNQDIRCFEASWHLRAGVATALGEGLANSVAPIPFRAEIQQRLHEASRFPRFENRP
jgi:hypothetical protein